MDLDEIRISSDNVQEFIKIVVEVAKVSLAYYKMLNFARYLSKKETMEKLLSLLDRVVYVHKSEEGKLVVMNKVFKNISRLGMNRYQTEGIYKFRFTLNEDYNETNNFIYDNAIANIARAYPDEYNPDSNLSFVRINSSDLGDALRACALLCRGKIEEIASYIDEMI
jgi:hypothetical protein